jgi:SSS family solute:Na+ symporter
VKGVIHTVRPLLICFLCLLPHSGSIAARQAGEAGERFRWQALPALPGPDDGVAGAFVGISNGMLMVAGGANFPVLPGGDRWEVEKVFHRAISVLQLPGDGEWRGGFDLSLPVAYGAVATTARGIICIGGDTGDQLVQNSFLLHWNMANERPETTALPDLPVPLGYGGAAAIGDVVYVAGGQMGAHLSSATNRFWKIDLAGTTSPGGAGVWIELPALPGPPRAFHAVVAQHNGFEDCIYVIGGRRVVGSGAIEALSDVWEYAPSKGSWRRRADSPEPIMAGTGAPLGQSHIFLPSGADAASLALDVERLRDSHHGFPRTSWLYHTITNTWIEAGDTPANQVTTPAVTHRGAVYLATGEIRPRTRTNAVWRITPVSPAEDRFGTVDYTVLGAYLLVMVGVGFWFARHNRSADDFFRGGQTVPWWVAGCSIFATMLSSITFLAIPAKAYSQDLVLLVANLMIPVVAPLAVFLALPFFRRMNLTSAYEYLESRFNRAVRMIASGLFAAFQLFRIGIVLSLAGLALASFTPLSPAQSVVLAGVLCVIYSTLGGLLAVVWTDTIQTFVLLGAILFSLGLAMSQVDGGAAGVVQIALADGKLHFANLDFSANSISMLAIWVVVLGGMGQNVSSYLADQSVVQRYMSTPDVRTAARSIWTNAVMVLPASILFFGMGTVLYAFYKTHPGLLDPGMKTDQIFPLFIATQVPVGLAGLIVAGIFAAAQSTVSTSMNSAATTVVTDFLQTLRICGNVRGCLIVGRSLNLAFGVLGTLLGLLFVRPGVTSLFDSFLTLIGLFLGSLGGIFLLGMLTRRANGGGALCGLALAFVLLLFVRFSTPIHWLLYAPLGVSASFMFGYVTSLFLPNSKRQHGNS